MTVVHDVPKQAARAMWAAGDYAVVAQLITEPAMRLVEACGIGPGSAVLDVATGTGNVAIAAAKRGASVTGLDLTPELLDRARARAAAAGVDVGWIEGDAELLQFPDASFDVVTSTFGVMFAPDRGRAAAELLRVCRPGGVIGLCSWTPEGVAGQYIDLLGRHLGAQPDDNRSTDWGRQRWVHDLFTGADTRDGAGLEFEFALDHAVAEFGSLDAGVEFLECNYGCAVTSRAKLEPVGRWEALRADIRSLFDANNRSASGSLLLAEAYLQAIIRKRR